LEYILVGHFLVFSFPLQANLEAVNLSASTFYVPDHSSMSYLNYGAATSEVIWQSSLVL